MLRVYTHNIRYARIPPVENELPWEERRDGVVNSILAHAPSIVCLQEVLWPQLEDILAGLNNAGSKWEYAGVGRDDGNKKGEFCVILYRSRVWKVTWTPFWLSPTPSKPSKGWDAALKRIVVQAHFQSIEAPQLQFFVYSTHFDHQGKTARAESARLILRLMRDQSGPQILCGDLNSQPDEPPSRVLAQELKDSHDCSRKFGHEHTYTSFGNEPHTRIDYIWHNDAITPKLYTVSHSHYGFFFSDHRPVVADLLFLHRDSLPDLESS